jgi:hypothetical protein
MGRRVSLNRRVGSETFYTEEHPAIMGTAIAVIRVGKLQVFARPPRPNCKWKFYRAWVEGRGRMREIGRIYLDGKFHPLKTKTAEVTMTTPGWGKAVRALKDAVLAHKVMEE